ncbi:MAG TPA: ATP-binding protein [Vicinamibacterales bacterium]|jgi:signal transduction histidine kinase
MTAFRSFRARMIFGSVLWTLGLLVMTTLIGMAVIHSFPRMVPIVHTSALIISATVCVVLGVSLLRYGLSPFDALRQRLAAVRDGRSRRVDGEYPSEVQPLVDDLNTLLEHRELVVARAISKAGDLAHGLKTPLAVLRHEAGIAAAAGHGELAAVLEQQIDRMQRHVDYHLAHARAVASGANPGARCLVAASAEGLARTLRRLHAERGVTIHVDVPATCCVRGQREDLDEMLGNVLDNACKWARTEVRISAAASEADVVITVDDDGQGLVASNREVVLRRGGRADEAAPGSGLGLAIVGDLVEVYGGAFSLHDSPLGGLRARIQLPTC